MSSPHQRAKAFIEKHQLFIDPSDASSFFQAFKVEMEKGLKGEPSSLVMLPTYISVDKNIPAHQSTLVIDAGGTNLRVCKVEFDEHGKETMSDFEVYPMPGTKGEVSAEQFFKLFADYISPILEDKSIKSIGFCFSYPAEILPNRDGRLQNWTKEVMAPEVVGLEIGKGILEHITTRDDLSLVILNDTVAALLTAKAEGESHQCSSYAGFILGTGTNMAIVVPDESILKLVNPSQGSQAINMESGNFSPPLLSDLDDAFDATTQTPGDYRLEKMISGAYLGPLFLTTLKSAGQEKTFSEQGNVLVASLTELNTKQLNDLISNPHSDGPLSGLSSEDLEIAYYLGQQLVDRAAWVSALKITASLRDLGMGKSPLHPLCITIDGSTVHKMKGLYGALEAHLKFLLGNEDIHFILSHRDHAPILGAAIAALTN